MKQLLLAAILLQTEPISQPVQTKITGRVVQVPGTPNLSPSTELLLRPMGQARGTGSSVRIRQDGTFEIPAVPPGEYDLNFVDRDRPFSAVFRTPEGRFFEDVAPVGPGRNFTFRAGDVSDFELKFPTALTGRVTGTGVDTSALAEFVVSSTTDVAARNANSGRTMRSSAVPGASGEFTLPVFSGNNTIGFLHLPAGYTVEAIRYGGIDVKDQPLKVEGALASTLVITVGRTPR